MEHHLKIIYMYIDFAQMAHKCDPKVSELFFGDKPLS